MMALSLKAANSAVLTRCSSSVGSLGSCLHEPLELVDLGGEVAARSCGRARPARPRYARPCRRRPARVTRTQARRGRMNSEPIRPTMPSSTPPSAMPLPGRVADLQLDPAVDAVEADRAPGRPAAARSAPGDSLMRASGPSRSGRSSGTSSASLVELVDRLRLAGVEAEVAVVGHQRQRRVERVGELRERPALHREAVRRQEQPLEAELLGPASGTLMTPNDAKELSCGRNTTGPR